MVIIRRVHIQDFHWAVGYEWASDIFSFSKASKSVKTTIVFLMHNVEETKLVPKHSLSAIFNTSGILIQCNCDRIVHLCEPLYVRG